MLFVNSTRFTCLPSQQNWTDFRLQDTMRTYEIKRTENNVGVYSFYLMLCCNFYGWKGDSKDRIIYRQLEKTIAPVVPIVKKIYLLNNLN